MWANRKSVDKDFETASAVRFQHRFKLVLLHNQLLAQSLPKNVQEMPRSTNGDQQEAFEGIVSNSNTSTSKLVNVVACEYRLAFRRSTKH